MRFLRPDMAVWLLAVPVIFGCWWMRQHHVWRHRRTKALTRLSRRTSFAGPVVLLTLSVAAVVVLTGAMMRPQLRAERLRPVYEKRDLVLILDRSVSMRARDIKPSRLHRALDEIEHFLRRKPQSLERVALVGFAGTAIVLSYPTDDLDSLLFYLQWLREDPTPFFGTDLSSALETAVAAMRRETAAERAGVGGAGRANAPPLFVVISDGDDQSATLDRTARAVAGAGIRVHCIGVGSYDSVPMPVPTEEGGEALLRGDGGRVLRTRFEESTLQRLASATGGRYVRSATGSELLEALETVAADERRQIGWISDDEYRDVHLWFLAAAAVSLTGVVTRL